MRELNLGGAAGAGVQIDMAELRRQGEAARNVVKYDFQLGETHYEVVIDTRHNGRWTAFYLAGKDKPWLESAFEITDPEMAKAMVQTFQKAFVEGEKSGKEKFQREVRALLGAPGYADVEPRNVRFGGAG